MEKDLLDACRSNNRPLPTIEHLDREEWNLRCGAPGFNSWIHPAFTTWSGPGETLKEESSLDRLLVKSKSKAD
jgi:hypothetical protein